MAVADEHEQSEVTMTLEEMIAAIQKRLGVQVDGRAGTET
jgi:hypothetical protein